MTDDERADQLGSLFESVTGDTSVVEQQRTVDGTRLVTGESADAVDPVEHHGLADAIDDPTPA